MVAISIIIVNYNTKHYLKNCIESIYQSEILLDQIEIIIIDNASKDSSITQLQKYINSNIKNAKIEIILNDSNLGFSKSINIGLDNSSGEYICILNPDTYIKKNCFNQLKKYMDDNLSISAITPKIINSDGSIQISCRRSLPKIVNSMYKMVGIDKLFPKNKYISNYNLLYLDEEEINEVEVISGAFMFLRSEIVKKVGYFDELFFLYAEDIDYCHRIKNNNNKITYYPLAEAIHYKGKSADSVPFKAIYEWHSSMIKYYTKYQDEYNYWRFFKILIVISIIIRKYLSYLTLIIKNIFK